MDGGAEPNPPLGSPMSEPAAKATEGRPDGVVSRAGGKPAAAAAAAATPAAPAAAAAPLLPQPRPAPKRTLLGLLCTLAAIGAVLTLAALAAWLYKPMSKAWSNKRAPDHPSENFFDLGKCVPPVAATAAAAARAPASPSPGP